MRTAGPLAPERIVPSPGSNYFFLWIARNPLKSPESDEEIQKKSKRIQENPSPLPWFFLVGLGSAWSDLARGAAGDGRPRLGYEEAHARS